MNCKKLDYFIRHFVPGSKYYENEKVETIVQAMKLKTLIQEALLDTYGILDDKGESVEAEKLLHFMQHQWENEAFRGALVKSLCQILSADKPKV